jgi:hypothetical protein
MGLTKKRKGLLGRPCFLERVLDVSTTLFMMELFLYVVSCCFRGINFLLTPFIYFIFNIEFARINYFIKGSPYMQTMSHAQSGSDIYQTTTSSTSTVKS